jgi:hypothetical protein
MFARVFDPAISVNNKLRLLIHSSTQVDDEQRPMNYSQTFQLLPDGAGSFYIFNDIFKLVFG